MRILIFIFAALLFPALAVAQQATVRSGEHSGFTRIVIPLSKNLEWAVEHRGREVTLRIPGTDAGFDTRRVFDLIPRDRLAEVRAAGDTLTLDLACDCRIAPFVAADRFVVLDIASPGVTRPVPFIARLDPAPPMAALATPPPTPAPSPSPEVILPVVPDRATARPLPSLQPLDLPEALRAPLNPEQQRVLNDLQKRLAQELGTAATRGLLEPVPGAALPSLTNPAVDKAKVDRETSAIPDLPATNPDGTPNNMRITSSMDFPGRPQTTETAQSLSGLACPANADLDISSWSDGRSFDQQMGELRQSLYGELDRLDADVARRQAQLYLYFGFGAEARQTLLLDPALAQEEWLLMDLAQIMETGQAAPGTRLAGLLDCASDVSLWAILSRERLDIARSIDPGPALLALNKLPVHLRQFLAPALSNRLLSHGDTDAAATALRSLERLPEALPPSAKLAQARIAIDEGAIDEGERGLEEIIQENAEQSPEALIDLVETRLAAGEPLDPETAGLIEAYAKELQDSAIGADLRRAHVLALAKSDQFDTAFAALQELGGESEEPAAVNLRLQLVQELAAVADDVVFLDHIFEQTPEDIARLPSRPKLAVTRRLLDLGFAAQAQEIVETMPERPLNENRQKLVARIALELDQPERAVAALGALSGEEADALRAEANRLAGDYAGAYEILSGIGREEEAAQVAWLDAATDAATLQDNPLFGPVVALTQRETTPTTEIDGMLARSTEALNEAAAARETLRGFLGAPELGLEIASE